MLNINKKNKTKNKAFEFLTIFSMAFGIVVGSGIYIKNRNEEGGVLDAANNNPYLAIIIWIFIGVVCTMMIISYVEISSAIKKDEHNTTLSWSAKFISRRSASVIAIFYISFYMPILASLGAIFTVSVFFDYGLNNFLQAMGKNTISETLTTAEYTALKVVLSSIILIGFQILNMFTQKPGRYIQTICTFIKFIPLIVVLIGGFVVFFTNNVVDASGNPDSTNSFENSTNKWEFWSFFATIVPIVFAFDGFIHAVTLQKDVENKKVVTPALFVGIISISVFYLLITIAIFIGGNDGNIFKLLNTIFIKVPILSFISKILIAFTVATLSNGYTTLIPKTIESASHEGFLYFGKNAKNISKRKASIISIIITLIIFYSTIIISLLITPLRDTNEINYAFISETISTSTVIFAFIVYYSLILAMVINRKTNKVKVNKIKGGLTIGIINIVILSLFMPYVYFEYLIRPFITHNKDAMICAAGSFAIIAIIAIYYGVNEFYLKRQKKLS
ncbi:APC family permease [Spiroplasma tabanidicola]|uniref:Amino acid permease n=1 Tax=Spiroplasma tabanidicola TaxID=324079 RepID=A0A6I6C634_9MOLU|nr:APC family permease [Spiroplasma tabanidicola]QGS51610.1 amino acid permease [Spiroplasma tabanidicola]